MSLVADAVANSRLAIQNCKEIENHALLLKRNKGICLIQAYLRASFRKTGQGTSTSSLLTLLPSQPPSKSGGWLCHRCLCAVFSYFLVVSPLDFYSFFFTCPVCCKRGHSESRDTHSEFANVYLSSALLPLKLLVCYSG